MSLTVLLFTCAYARAEVDVSLSTNYNDHVDITVPGYSTGSTVLNAFPLLIRISEDSPRGFSYDRAGSQGRNIRFAYAVMNDRGTKVESYQVVPHEIDTWNAYGTSYIWVRHPALDANTRKKLVMYWAEKEFHAIPENVPESVWSAYAGVWHMNGADDSTESHAAGSVCDAAVLYSDGAIGNALGSHTGGAAGPLVTVTPSDAVNALAESGFTASMWMRLNTFETAFGYLFSRKSADDTAAYGAQFRGPDNKTTATGNAGWLHLYEGASATAANSGGSIGLDEADTGRWVKVDVVLNRTFLECWVDGVRTSLRHTRAVTPLNGDLDLAIGGLLGTVEQGTLNGDIDEFRLWAGCYSDSDVGEGGTTARARAEYEQVTNLAYVAFGKVYRNGKIYNYWTTEPTMTQTTFEPGVTESEILDAIVPGVPQSGTPVLYYIDRRTGVTNASPVTAAGDYRIVFSIPESDTESALSHSIYYRVKESSSEGKALDGERILLLNDDYSLGEGTEVDCQAYDWASSAYGTPWWEHLDENGHDDYNDYLEETSYYFNFLGGIHHVLHRADGSKLWELMDVRFGNTFQNWWEFGPFEWDEGLKTNQNYLAWNPESQRVVGGGPVNTYQEQAGQAVLRNTTSAAIYSPYYADGVGTVYFDAVNAFSDDAGEGYYRLVLEVATNALERVYETLVPTTKPPTDENVSAGSFTVVTNRIQIDEYNFLVTVDTNWYPCALADWKPVATTVLRFSGETSTNLGEHAGFDLDVRDGGSFTNFYRFYAALNWRMPARFRIRRETINPNYTYEPDRRSQILVDNVICSRPTACVELAPLGYCDETKTGKQVCGWENAWSVPYPSVADPAVYARARATLAGSDGKTPATSAQVTAAAIHYRWHYLDQADSGWLDADMVCGSDGIMQTRDPLALPGIAGDVEFWFELSQSTDFYTYVDYTALGLGVPGYTEEQGGATNRAPGYAENGDWFVRIRDGQSDYGDLRVQLKTSAEADATVTVLPMEIVDSHAWRAYYQTTNALSDGVWFRVEAANLQTPGTFEYATNSVLWAPLDDWTAVPASGRLREVTTNDWRHVPCDAATGYLLFQVDDATKGMTVVHADYQNFNRWHDANRNAEIFVGTSTEDEAKTGTSPKTRDYEQSYAGFEDTLATNVLWCCTMPPKEVLDVDPKYPSYQMFRENEWNGWSIGKGMWIYGAYRDERTGSALQMAGQGDGFIQFVNADESPRGLENVAFKARIAQHIALDNFTYFDGDDHLKLTNYTFAANVTFDTAMGNAFSGNASLSLVAYYRDKRGCYEARWEQLRGVVNTADGTVTGPDKTGQRLALYRWRFNQTSGTYAETLLFAVTNYLESGWKVTMPYGNYATNSLMPMYVSAYRDSRDRTVITAGVRSQGVAPSTSSFNGSGWYSLAYCDAADEKLTAGTYGILSANCPGLFHKPTVHWKEIDYRTTLGSSAELMDNCGKSIANKTITFPTLYRACRQDIEDDQWAIELPRQNAYDFNQNHWGFGTRPVVQQIGIYTAGAGKTNWKLVKTIDLDGFGSAGAMHDVLIDFWTTTDTSLRIASLEEVSDRRTDVVIDDIVMRQWRGEHWWGSTVKERQDYGPNTFVYTSGWVTNSWGTNRAVRLSAKRTAVGTACSIRTPAFDGYSGRGKGLGMITFDYCNAQSNARLFLQIATNVTYTSLGTISLDPDVYGNTWHTVATYDFATLPSSGTISCFLGIHGVQGLMRLVVDPALVEEVVDSTDPSLFGEVDILRVFCRDEPELNLTSWWGWNMRTFGDACDSEHKMFLPDVPRRTGETHGMSAALNNSVYTDIDEELVAKDPDVYRRHMPFIQTPTFTSNIVGEITFRARKYEVSDASQPAEIRLYGAKRGDIDGDDSAWTELAKFTVTNSIFEVYSVKTDPGDNYRAFRIAVTGVTGVTPFPGPRPELGTDPVRVILDEIVVYEAVRARLGFRNVGAFRYDLANNSYIADPGSKRQQPLCEEDWGVEAEVYAAMLEDQIDKSYEPRVILHWFVGEEPWGFENWKDEAGARSAELSKAEGTNLVYRSSYLGSPEAVVPAEEDAPTVVQFTLELQYKTLDSKSGKSSPVTNYLASSEWTRPDWYAPVDYNNDRLYGAGKYFAAYNILDSVAPGWAWINEFNIFGKYDRSYQNNDRTYQWVEVAAPAEADLAGWYLQFLEPLSSGTRVSTNTVAIFGQGGVASTKDAKYMQSNMVFYVVGSQKTALNERQPDPDDGRWDGMWEIANTGNAFDKQGMIWETDPIGIRLVRASGVVEHQIVLQGDNVWGGSVDSVCSQMNALSAVRSFFVAGIDNGGETKSLGVFDSQGESSNVWNNVMVHTPGRVNENQRIDPNHPTPLGDNVILYASVAEDPGHIVQTVGDIVSSNVSTMVVLQRGNRTGTNITYTVDRWYELGEVSETENGKARTPVITKVSQREWRVNVARLASNSVTVVTSAKIRDNLRDLGLDGNNPYTPAVMDWLENGKTLKGDFADSETEEIALAEYWPLDRSSTTNLTLTQMYILDMDPTVSNLVLWAGTPEIGPIVKKDVTSEQMVTNVRMTVFMEITNKTEDTSSPYYANAYAPYVIRGLAPGSHSQDGVSTGKAWTNDSFIIEAILLNGLTSEDNWKNWLTQRAFYFDDDSFYSHADELADPENKAFTAKIEIRDPVHLTDVPGYGAGWYNWVKEHGETPFTFRWNFHDRTLTFGSELLKKNSYFE